MEQKIRGISNIVAILMIVLVLAIAGFLTLVYLGSRSREAAKETYESAEVGGELKKGDELEDIEVDLEQTRLGEIDSELNEAFNGINTD